jgi:hypothetical protein
VTKGGIERRRAPRAAAELPIQLQRPAGGDGALHVQPATLKDISANGLCCALGQPMQEMTLVKLDLPLPNETSTISVSGVVVRCDKIRGVPTPTYEIGVYFHDLDSAGRTRIERFVQDRLAVQN